MATKTMPPRSSRPASASKPRQTRLDFSKSAGKSSTSKPKAQPNASILSFFKKTDGPQSDEPGLFLESRRKTRIPAENNDEITTKWDDEESFAQEVSSHARYNENSGSVKKRKLSGDSDSPQQAAMKACSSPVNTADAIQEDTEKHVHKRTAGPFLEDSDSEEEQDLPRRAPPAPKPREDATSSEDTASDPKEPRKSETPPRPEEEVGEESDSMNPGVPQLKREPTSYAGADGFDDFEGLEDFDEFEEDEEFGDEERRWMKAQRMLGLEDVDMNGDPNETDLNSTARFKVKLETEDDTTTLVTDAPVCPICNASLEGVSDQNASVHVNNCLDGNPTPVPRSKEPAHEETVKVDGANRFQRPARPAKPGQANPFTLGAAQDGSTSAFTKLMSGHAEDAAWAGAAAAERASRGKPSYQRTCPFYKILPGFSICVDAFRYGAVQGCEAYFLSHFHSDHYVGLTANWKHGPIYCSRVTANLVRQQLGVDSKWVVALDWEKETEVPRTDGVKVTMIPANHCPGSSLFLFEKAVGKGKNPRMQRVLHCGDFRACRAHIEHPLLRPDVLDAVSGKTRQQKLDVCYLDTTYLNPKYAFPAQDDVIQACADMCVSLNRVRADETDGWEQMKRDRAGEGMVKFIRKGSDLAKEDGDGAADPDPMKVADGEKERGKLLVIVGTYSIGKERMCLGIAKAMDSKIYAPPAKMRVCAALEDAELNARLTRDPREAQVHMTPLFEIRAETLDDYLKDYRGTFARAVGFRPTGWNYRPPNSRFTENPAVQTVLRSESWRSGFGMRDLVPQRGSTGRAACFGVPYSEHSSFRELTMFCCALRIDKVIPTVNVGSAKSREKMKAWCDKWAVEKRKNGLFRLEDGEGW